MQLTVSLMDCVLVLSLVPGASDSRANDSDKARRSSQQPCCHCIMMEYIDRMSARDGVCS